MARRASEGMHPAYNFNQDAQDRCLDEAQCPMSNAMRLQAILTEASGERADRLAVFALLALGLVESLANGLLSASGAVQAFFNAENGLYVRKQLRDKVADEVMARGVQLPDLFEVLPAEEAQREFQRELVAMRSLCLELLGRKRSVA